ncbi:hypothetical protein QR680_019305 [Steinernema hermaphroditum]|uniref:Uncharacterized protein n=1 Tax=Steinernema hermaphroditum TaxID=289476 RepID=A0AA39GMX8_9BILA|nr:hypothetical protein QR680_019305 [Steinernema hermaphroditum]
MDKMHAGQEEKGLERLQDKEPEKIMGTDADVGKDATVSSIAAPIEKYMDPLDIPEPHVNRKRKRVENDEEVPAPKTLKTTQVAVRTCRTMKVVEAEYIKLIEEMGNDTRKLLEEQNSETRKLVEEMESENKKLLNKLTEKEDEIGKLKKLLKLYIEQYPHAYIPTTF